MSSLPLAVLRARPEYIEEVNSVEGVVGWVEGANEMDLVLNLAFCKLLIVIRKARTRFTYKPFFETTFY